MAHKENETIVHGLMKIFQDLYVFRDLYLRFKKKHSHIIKIHCVPVYHFQRMNKN